MAFTSQRPWCSAELLVLGEVMQILELLCNVHQSSVANHLWDNMFSGSMWLVSAVGGVFC
jgi:hypothetical protein